MPKRTDIKRIMVIGSGPIVIGQAAEFDYAGTQACLALKEEGYEVILCNSNPATIMTDTMIADKVYMEPLTLEYIAKIIRKERPDAILPGIGGQTGLNLAMELERKGVLKECQVELLGTSSKSIERAEDRELFKEMCESIGEPVIPSQITYDLNEARRAAAEIARKEAAERRKQKAAEFAAALDAIPRIEVQRGEDFATRRKEKYYPKLSNITSRTDVQKLFPLVVLDVETTGLKPANNDIIEVSAIKYASPFVPESCFTSLCKPRRPIPAEATAINHITDNMVTNAPDFSEIAANLSEYIRDCNIVGQNVEFDTDFLYASGVDLPETRYFDTCQLARYVDKDLPNYKLETLLNSYGIVRDTAHRSLSDAYATGLLFEKLVQEKRS